MHNATPEYIIARLNWLLEDLITDDRGLSATELRNVLAGRDLLDSVSEVAA